jgi:hypothetical protein
MHIKRYTIASFILIALFGWVGTFSDQEISINIFGILLPPLSVAFIIMIPMAVLYLASLTHIAFYSILSNFKLRKYEKDYDMILDAVSDAYLGKENRNYHFKTQRYKTLGSLVDNTTFIPNGINIDSIDEDKIRNVIKLMENIKNGEVEDLKKLNLPDDNALVKQNNRNRYNKEQLSAEDILSNPAKYDQELLQDVYIDFVKTSPVYAIENYKEFMTKEALFVILTRVNADENTLEISNETLIKLFSELELDTKDYIEISQVTSRNMIPEQRIKLFEMLSDENDEAMEAYLYTLFDLEMIAPADAILEISQPDEFLNFKAYRALKENNKHFNINLFI